MKGLKDSRLMLVVSMTVFGTIGAFVRHIDLPSGQCRQLKSMHKSYHCTLGSLRRARSRL